MAYTDRIKEKYPESPFLSLKPTEEKSIYYNIKITDEMWEIAHKKAKEMGKLNNSITKGENAHFGFAGELGVQKILNIPCSNNTYNFDLIYNGLRLEVKTKPRKTMLFPDYDCSVANFNTHQKCDAYVFTSINEFNNVLEVAGWMPPKEFKKRSTFVPKGSIDSNTIFKDGVYKKFVTNADCWNLDVKDLYPFRDLINGKTC
jgi:hypothetical protein